MQTPATNPIYDRLTCSSRWPGQRAAIGIGIGVGAILSLTTIFTANTRPLLYLIAPLLLAPVVALGALCQLIGLVAAATMAGRHALDEDFALLRLSSIPAGKIAAGYVDGILYRLRMLRALAVWSPAAAASVVSVVFVIDRARMCRIRWCQDGIVWAVVSALVGIALGTLFLYFMTKFLLRIGVWIGLLRARNAATIAGVVALASPIAGYLLIAASAVIVPSYDIGCLVAEVTGVLILTGSIENQLHTDSVLWIDGQLGGGSPAAGAEQAATL